MATKGSALTTGFRAALGEAAAGLRALQAGARQQMPGGWVPWFAGSQAMGWVPPERARWMLAHLHGAVLSGAGLQWRGADTLSPAQRSRSVQHMLLQASREGQLSGWRDERFSFWHAGCEEPLDRESAFLEVERAGFRFLGLLSHAVHVNGFLPDGRLWVARRALSKSTDPGMLDNLAAGGLPCGEAPLQCLWRELHEEAGLGPQQVLQLQPAGRVRTSRQEPQGWHDEVLHVFNLQLADGCQPRNLDGEVGEFLCLTAGEVLSQIRAGAFTADAVQALVLGLQTEIDP